MIELSSQHNQMRRALSQWVDIPDELWTPFAETFTLRVFSEKEIVIDVHEPFDKIFFVSNGLLRIYYLSASGKEFNKSFITENMFAGSFSVWNGNTTISCGIQSLENTELLAANYTDFAAFYDKHPVFDRLGRKFLEWLLVRKEQREQSFLLDSAKKRFQDFADQSPDLIKRIPQYHLASYLGITEVQLSRLKRIVA